MHDVTEHEGAGEEVNRVHDLESIGLLAGGLSHDFNNVLNIIYGNITFARMLAGDNTAISEPLADAEEACERARRLGIQLQAFSRVSSPVKEPIMLIAIVEDAAGALFKGTNISHTISAADGIFPVEADSRQIRQTFENLLTNAKEAMPEGGAVKIDIENCMVDDNQGLPLGSGLYVCIALQDNGKGIPKENLQKIFDPCYSTKDTCGQRGVGLGLPICNTIMKRHGGHISVESGLGHGTRVTIYLPASREDKRIAAEGMDELPYPDRAH
jgi:signal transduction histidine kinase